MTARSILQVKGTDVVTVSPTTSLDEVVRVLARRGIGAAVVQAHDGTVLGVVSERDVVLAISEHGAAALDRAAYDAMAAAVTCEADDPLPHLMALMTSRRTRHLPVVEDGALRGLVSIGDVVKHRLEEVEVETNVLREYIVYAG